MKLLDSIPALKTALKGEPGEIEAWLEVNDELTIKLAILYLVKEQDQKTRRACAEAVATLAATKGTLLFVELTRAHAACMNVQAL